MEDFTPTSRELPPNGLVVDAMDSGGHVQPLKRKGNFWWFPDDSMYVYFVPTYWKRHAAAEIGKQAGKQE